KVLELESFSKAANAVFLAQASVSERIATLEDMVGTRLFDRMGRQVVPTAAGNLLYKHACLLLEMKMAACNEMPDYLGIKKGEIYIGGSTIPGEYILPKVIGRFHEKHPLITVKLAIADTNEIENRVFKGKLELGVIGSKSFHAGFLNRELWEDELVLAVSAGHKWAGRKEIAFKKLSKEPFIFRETGSGTLKIIKEYFKMSGSDNLDSLNVVARFGSSTAVKEGIKSGLGVSILSSRALETELKAGVLKALKVKGLFMSRKFYLIRDKRRNVSPLCQAMLDFLIATSSEVS
ncbi:MAG: selenium metabolism-associated LysR family transcriptional regulator, partial [Desulfobacterales bacterium]|nr:selenium metabolism-associated LysR family transcriptional regulator [Desulfobacterales bacterium]MDX2508123.1 selenium metabolism-associated LysR family transcriptional regulator [Desulfobacterales bacterium]